MLHLRLLNCKKEDCTSLNISEYARTVLLRVSLQAAHLRNITLALGLRTSRLECPSYDIKHSKSAHLRQVNNDVPQANASKLDLTTIIS